MSGSRKRGLQKAPSRVRAPTRQPEQELEHPVADQIARDDNALLVPLARIRVLPGQPRQTFTEESIAELAEDIRENGLVNPLTVTQDGQVYNLVAGERRLRALQLLKASDAPVRVVPTENARAIQLAENLQREDLPLLEEAQALAALRDEQELTVRKLAEAVKKSRSYVHRRLEILTWPEDVQALLQEQPGLLTQAASLAKIPDAKQRQDRIAALLDPEASTKAATEGNKGKGRPPTPFKFAERKDGGFDLQVRYRPHLADREEIIAQLKQLIQTLEDQSSS